MAARRLIAVMLVLLFLSSLAAALAPPVEEPAEEGSTPTTSEPARPEPADDGKVLRERLDAGAKGEPTIEATVGDQLQLRVSGDRVATIELGGIGASDDVGPEAPASFDVLLNRAGTFPVRILESGERIGAISVRPPGSAE